MARAAKEKHEEMKEERRGEHMPKRKAGGRPGDKEGAKTQIYNAEGSKAVESAEDEEPGFKDGGKTEKRKLKEGGKPEGEHTRMRMDRKPRGEHMPKRAAGGRTPYSSGRMLESSKNTGPGQGHEGSMPTEDD